MALYKFTCETYPKLKNCMFVAGESALQEYCMRIVVLILYRFVIYIQKK